MKIIRPQKIQEENLIEVKNLEKELQEEGIENKKLQNISKETIEAYDKKWERTIISNTDIMNSKLEKNSFTDVIFKNCNFSNTSFENSCFIRCEFDNCKITGCNFIETTLYQVSFIETNANYLNLTTASLENVLFQETLLRNSFFQETKLKNIALESTDLSRAQFFKTSLKDMDLSRKSNRRNCCIHRRYQRSYH